MVRRSSSAFFSHFSHSSSTTHASAAAPPPSLPVTPNSPVFIDPFGASINLPEPIRRSSTFPHASGASTPKILIASPSTSTIHYLFPTSETRTGTHLTVGRSDKLSRSDSSASSASTRSTGSTGSTKLKQRSRVRTEGGFHLPTMAGSMRTLRRQPSMADLGGNKQNLHLKIGVTQSALVDLPENQDIERRVDSREKEKERPKLSPADISSPIPLSDPRAWRRRSQSLSSPRPAPSPPPASPQLPAPDLGAPLARGMGMAQSPSYTHIDYSPAPSPSATSVASNGRNRHSRGWSMHSKAIYPYPAPPAAASAAMVREVRGVAEREGGGRYPSPTNPREEAIRRLSGYATTTSETYSYDTTTRDRRRRSQSMSSESVSPRWNISPPLPWAPDLTETARKRRESSAYSPTWTDASLYHSSSPVRPAFQDSEVSLLAPTTVGLGFSPVSSPGSLPSSLEEQAIDLSLPPTAPSTAQVASPEVILSPAPDLPCSPPREEPGALSPHTEVDTPRSRRSAIGENTYYLPGQPRPLRMVRSSEVLARSSSLSPRTPELVTPDFSRLAPSPPIPTAPIPSLARSLSMRFRSSTSSPQTSALADGGKQEYTSHTAHSRHFHLPRCSTPTSIDPLPTQSPPAPIAGTRRGIKSSASIRGLGNRISRSLSTVFDTRDHAKLEFIRLREEAIKSRISSPLEAGRPDREFREGLLQQVVSSSIGSKLSEYTQNSLESTRTRPGIPQVLLESAPIVEKQHREAKYSTLRGLRRSIRRSNAVAGAAEEERGRRAAVSSPDSFVHVLPPPSPPPSIRGGSVRTGSVRYNEPTSIESESPQVSRWSPSPPKRKLRLIGRAGSPPPPSWSARAASDPLPVPHRADAPPIPPRSLSRTRLFFKPAPPAPTFSPDGVSNTDMMISSPQPLLEQLSSLPLSQTTPEEKHQSLKAWRDDVRDTREIAILEGQMMKHVEMEREKMREISGGTWGRKKKYGGMI